MDSMAVVTTLTLDPCSKPTFPVADPVSGRVFIPLNGSTRFVVVQGTSILRYVNIPAPNAGPWGIALDADPSSRRLYIGLRTGCAIQVFSINGASETPAGTIAVGSQVYSLAVNRTLGYFYAVHTASCGSENPANLINRYQRNSLTPDLSNYPLNNTFDGGSVGINPLNGGRLYVAETATNTFDILFNGLGRRSGFPRPIAAAPLGVAVDESMYRIYITSRSGGVITVYYDTEAAGL
jgi:hypothetical protein